MALRETSSNSPVATLPGMATRIRRLRERLAKLNGLFDVVASDDCAAYAYQRFVDGAQDLIEEAESLRDGQGWAPMSLKGMEEVAVGNPTAVAAITVPVGELVVAPNQLPQFVLFDWDDVKRRVERTVERVTRRIQNGDKLRDLDHHEIVVQQGFHAEDIEAIAYSTNQFSGGNVIVQSYAPEVWAAVDVTRKGS